MPVFDGIDTRNRGSVLAGLSVAAALGLAVGLVAWGCSSGPVADGPTLLNSRCSSCHSAQRGLTARKTPAEWEQTVTRMIGKGAKVNNAERAVLVDYLSKTAGS